MKHSSLFVLLLLISAYCFAESREALVVVPVADVWSRPLEPGEKPADDLRETQVLFGEKVMVHESSGGWARIAAVQQPEFTHHNRWESYPGWVSTESVKTQDWPIARALKPGSRQDIVRWASQWAGTPYRWGGLSSDGIDCSGLTHLAYRKSHIQIPRDSHEQWMASRRIKRAKLRPSDLIFISAENHPKKIVHVALYIGGGRMIEAPQTGMVVREIPVAEKLGKPWEQIETGNSINGRTIYFGSFLK